MKLKNKWLLNTLKIGLDVAWYLNFITAAITLYQLVKSILFRNDYIFALPVRLATTLERYYPTYLINGDSVTMQAHEGSLIVTTPNPFFQILSILSFVFYRVLFIAILYQLRKVFTTFYRNEPFQYQNIARLKTAALYIALYFPLLLIDTLVDHYLLKSYTTKFSLAWHFPYAYLGVAAIVYVTAEILRYGFELKKENEEFI